MNTYNFAVNRPDYSVTGLMLRVTITSKTLIAGPKGGGGRFCPTWLCQGGGIYEKFKNQEGHRPPLVLYADGPALRVQQSRADF